MATKNLIGELLALDEGTLLIILGEFAAAGFSAMLSGMSRISRKLLSKEFPFTKVWITWNPRRSSYESEITRQETK